jgi:hypothetical protein
VAILRSQSKIFPLRKILENVRQYGGAEDFSVWREEEHWEPQKRDKTAEKP